MEILLSNRKKDRSMQPHGLSSNGLRERSLYLEIYSLIVKSLVAKGWIERLTAKKSERKVFFMMELF